MKKLLLTNDDGMDADGLVRLAEAASGFGEVWVVAPDRERSSLSHSISLKTGFELWESPFPVPGVHAFACSGTPADCVRIGVLNVVPGRPDCVLSGINHGYNAATDLQYSATVGAALEAAFQGIHGIALSEDTGGVHEVTDRYLKEILGELIEKKLPGGKIWNVNFPGCRLEQCRGILRGRRVSGECYYRDHYRQTVLPSGKIYCHVEGVRDDTAEEGTDLRAIYDRYVSVGAVTNIS